MASVHSSQGSLFQLKDGQDTPLIRQYLEIKEKCKDAILFYRLGDFYEMFFDDAVTASKILDIALTSRDKGAKHPIPLCGVPHHSSKSYISKLLDAGHKVAICEQIEDAAAAQGIVKRDIVKIISSGTRSDEEGLLSDQTNHIASLFVEQNKICLTWMDISSGAIQVTSFSDVDEVQNFILTLSPSEIVLPNDDKISSTFEFLEKDPRFANIQIEKIVPWIYEQAEKELLTRYQVSHVQALGIDDMPGVTAAIFGLLYYIEEKNHIKVPHAQRPTRFIPAEYAHIDFVTQENLELFGKKQSNQPSLFSVLNQTVTNAGARSLRSWIQKPLRNINTIQKRLDVVEHFVTETAFRNDLRNALKSVTDIERIFRRLVNRTSTVSDLVSLRITLRQIPNIRKILTEQKSDIISSFLHSLDPCEELTLLLEAAIDDQASASTQEGFIRKGYNSDLDRLRSVASDNRQWLAELETFERKKTSIPSLKVSYNRVFGYYIEVTKIHHDKVPSYYIRKQTLVSSERYVTPELKEKEEEILVSKERTIALELKILDDIRSKAAGYILTLQKISNTLSNLDVHASLAYAAVEYRYVKPQITLQGTIDIKNGRHAIVERSMTSGSFIPNDTLIGTDAIHMILLTGPNMAGKSTIMRQVALMTIMAQMGSYVPADMATIGIVDQIFTRIGASDDLAGGRSTFMVEMNETAQILSNATKDSLILLDEIGRGTSTYDGLSIAWAVAEDIHDRIGAKTIFATHYHELAELCETKPHIQNMRMAIREWKDKIVFLRKMENGITERSYGIEVAQLAGVRPEVISRAKEVLKSLERPSSIQTSTNTDTEKVPSKPHPLIQELEQCVVDHLAPKEALDLIYHWKNRYF